MTQKHFKTTQKAPSKKLESEHVPKELWNIQDIVFAKLVLQKDFVGGKQLQKSLDELTKSNNESKQNQRLGQWLVKNKILTMANFSSAHSQYQQLVLHCSKCQTDFPWDKLDLENLVCPECKGLLKEPKQLQEFSLTKIEKDFGNYTLIEEIARGGMGIVYKAEHKSLGRIVALKVMRPEVMNEEKKERFHREIVVAGKLSHPHIVAVNDAGAVEEKPYYTMEFIDGQALDEKIKQGPIALKDAVAIVEKVARAMFYAHNQGVIHRDLKPANIIIDKNGEPHVTDMGLAKDINSTSGLTQTGTALGTPYYMSPEQVEGKIKSLGPKSDVYSLGVILYELIAQKVPFFSNSLSKLFLKITTEMPPGLEKVNPQLEKIILKAMAKKPAQRYLTAKTFADDLQKFLGKKDSKVAKKATRKGSKRKTSSQKKSNVVWIVPVLILIVISLAVMSSGSKKNVKLAKKTKTKSKSKKSSSLQKSSVKNSIKSSTKKPSSEELKKSKQASLSKKMASLKRGRKATGIPPQKKQRLAKANRPDDWPLTLWRECLNTPSVWVDFTKNSWRKLSAYKQFMLAKNYQEWYSARFGITLEYAYDLIAEDSDKIVTTYLRLIPPGRFLMGSPPDEPGRKNDEKQHPVLISRPFYMSIHEVTQELWEAAMEKNNSYFKDRKKRPVERTPWEKVQAFCKNTKLRLPTEAEWEYACRAGVLGMSYIGNFKIFDQRNAPTLDQIAWYPGNSGVKFKAYRAEGPAKTRQYPTTYIATHNVGQKKPNPWGLYDMIGNVWEWCSDFYGAYPTTPQINPTGPTTGKGHVARGGAFYGLAKECRSASRSDFLATGTHRAVFHFGFRVCKGIKFRGDK